MADGLRSPDGCLLFLEQGRCLPVRHVQYMPDGSVILKLYERRPSGRARHLRVSLARWLAGRGIYLLESHASRRAQALQFARRCG
jgi:hypothetical protein